MVGSKPLAAPADAGIGARGTAGRRALGWLAFVLGIVSPVLWGIGLFVCPGIWFHLVRKHGDRSLRGGAWPAAVGAILAVAAFALTTVRVSIDAVRNATYLCPPAHRPHGSDVGLDIAFLVLPSVLAALTALAFRRTRPGRSLRWLFGLLAAALTVVTLGSALLAWVAGAYGVGCL